MTDFVYILFYRYGFTDEELLGVFSSWKKAVDNALSQVENETDVENYSIFSAPLDAEDGDFSVDSLEYYLKMNKSCTKDFIPVQIEYSDEKTVFVPQDFFILLAKEKMDEAKDMLEKAADMPIWEVGKDEVFPSINRVSHNGDMLMEF